MKGLHGKASAPVSASPEESFSLLSDLEDYPRWYPDAVRSVQVVERSEDGFPGSARAQLHMAYGPLVRDFNLLLTVSLQRPSLVRLSRVPHDASDPEEFVVTWRISERMVTVELDASLSVPRLLPVGGIGESIASGFASAAARELNRSR